MQLHPLGYPTFFDSPTDYERVTHGVDTIERMHRRALRQARRRRD